MWCSFYSIPFFIRPKGGPFTRLTDRPFTPLPATSLTSLHRKPTPTPSPTPPTDHTCEPSREQRYETTHRWKQSVVESFFPSGGERWLVLFCVSCRCVSCKGEIRDDPFGSGLCPRRARGQRPSGKGPTRPSPVQETSPLGPQAGLQPRTARDDTKKENTKKWPTKIKNKKENKRKIKTQLSPGLSRRLSPFSAGKGGRYHGKEGSVFYFWVFFLFFIRLVCIF